MDKRSKILNAITVIRHKGDPTRATTLLGQHVERRQKLFVKELRVDVPCTPYDNHFIYETDPRIKDIPSYMCTCGAPAVVINAEKNSRMFVCLFHASYGRHTIGG